MSGGRVKTKMNPHLPGSYSFEFYMRRNSECTNIFLGFFVLTYCGTFLKHYIRDSHRDLKGRVRDDAAK